MIMLNIEVEQGFRKADINNIPTIRSEAIFAFATKLATNGSENITDQKNVKDSDLRVDYVQVRRTAELYEVKAIVFPAASGNTGDEHVRVSLKIDNKTDQIAETACEQCPKTMSCMHTVALIFWLHRKSTDTELHAIRDFWGTEMDYLADEERSDIVRIRDTFACDELRLEADLEAANVSNDEGQYFLNAVLNEMENIGLKDTSFYKHCRPVVNEFEPLFVHHTLLDAPNNGVKDVRTFSSYMEDHAKQGLFDRLTEVSKGNYKSPLWLETQFCRLRCSLMHRIASRKDTKEDERIFESIFCKEREYNVEERQNLKRHKRFILKQTEKLENKTYGECGLMLNESYPYICATPDGITDDHIVEIKAPKTEDEFEKYLEYRETIAPKYMAQIQTQMYMANVTKALYCVLSPTFDTNGALHYVWVQADMEFVASLLSAAEDYWREYVFPRLSKIYLSNQQ